MKKRILSMAVTGVLAVGLLAGCGTSSASDSDGSSVTAETVSADETESASGESALLQQIHEQGYITIATSNDAPYSYYDTDTDELVGLDVEILKGICEKLDIPEIRTCITDFGNLLIELNNGNADMVVDSMYCTDERKELAAFSDVWYADQECIVTKTDSVFTTKESLVDAVVGGQSTMAQYEMVEEEWLPEGKIKELVGFENQTLLLEAVNTGKIDAAIMAGTIAGYAIREDSTLDLKIMSPYESEQPGMIASAVRFEDEDFLEEVNAALNEMKEDGSLKEILESYNLPDEYYVGVEDGYIENIK